MAAQREPGARIIDDDVFAFMRRREQRNCFGDQRVLEQRGRGFDARDRPVRKTPVPRERCQRIGVGEQDACARPQDVGRGA